MCVPSSIYLCDTNRVYCAMCVIAEFLFLDCMCVCVCVCLLLAFNFVYKLALLLKQLFGSLKARLI